VIGYINAEGRGFFSAGNEMYLGIIGLCVIDSTISRTSIGEIREAVISELNMDRGFMPRKSRYGFGSSIL